MVFSGAACAVIGTGGFISGFGTATGMGSTIGVVVTVRVLFSEEATEWLGEPFELSPFLLLLAPPPMWRFHDSR